MSPIYIIAATAVGGVVVSVLSSIVWGFGRANGERSTARRYADGWEVLLYTSGGRVVGRGPFSMAALLDRRVVDADIKPNENPFDGPRGDDVTRYALRRPDGVIVHAENFRMPITLDTWAETHLKIDVHQDPREFLYLDPERDRSVTFTLTPQ